MQWLARPQRTAYPPLAESLGVMMETVNAAAAVGIAKAVNAAPEETVLELGFGAGLALETVARLQPQATLIGVELSEEMVAACTQRLQQAAGLDASRVSLHHGSVMALPLPAASVDVIYHLNCIYFWDPLASALKECLRVLKPGGRMVAGTRAAQISQTLRIASPDGEGPFRNLRTDRIMGALETAGFADVREEYIEAKKLPQSFSLIHSRRPAE